MKKQFKLILLPLLSLAMISCGKTEDKETKKSELPVTSEPASDSQASEPQEDDKIHIIVLAGQSGARGKAKVADLSEEDKEENYDVDIMADGLTMPQLTNIPDSPTTSTLQPVKPGLGDSSSEFGPEIGMGKLMATRYPKDGDSRKSVIVKYTACGSTFTDHWYSKSLVEDDTYSSYLDMKQIREDKNGNATGPLTYNLYQLVQSAIDTITTEGYEPVIDGVVFCHGEQDAKFTDNMTMYETALKDFIKDFRDYFNLENLPFVISEAGTNAARYSNKLREIQKKVADSDANISYVSTADLYTNTFEPWHFGADDNLVLGERMAEEIVKLNDNRKIVSFESEESYSLPLNGKVSLPEYLTANFSNGTQGIIKVEYPDGVDDSTLGEKKVKVQAKTNWGTFSSELDVNITDDPYIDGNTSEWTTTTHKINDKVSVGFYTNDDGIFVRAEVKDTELWTDGEAWESGDMGQKGSNDDLRVFLTDSTASKRISAFLSSDNLLRVYDSDSNGSYIPANNMVYKKYLENYQSKVVTAGEVNVCGGGEGCTGMTMEFYLPFEEIGITDAENLKVAVCYSDISKANESDKKTETITFLTGSSETDDNSYTSISELL